MTTGNITTMPPRRDVLKKIGLWHDGYDRFGYTDYLNRIKAKGYFSAFVHGTKTIHFHHICIGCGEPIEIRTGKKCKACGYENDMSDHIQDFKGDLKYDKEIQDFKYKDII